MRLDGTAVSNFPKEGPARELEANWKYEVGRMTQEMANTHLFQPSETSLALFCGPPPMINFACKPFCGKMGYREEDMVVF